MAARIDLEARYSVASMPGVAFYAVGMAKEVWPESWELDCTEDHEHEEVCYLYGEPEEYDSDYLARVVMVGDDREHIVDIADLTEIGDEDYCPGCGQIGCRAYG